MLSKTSLNKMKKDELVEYILKGQEKAGRDALFAEEDENAELKRRNKNIEWEVDDAERRASGILSYWSNENKILKEGLTSNLSEYNTLKQKYDALEQEFKWRLTDECEVAVVDIAFDEQWEVVKRRTHVDLLHRSCVEMEALKEQNKELKAKLNEIKRHYDEGNLYDCWDGGSAEMSDDYVITVLDEED